MLADEEVELLAAAAFADARSSDKDTVELFAAKLGVSTVDTSPPRSGSRGGNGHGTEGCCPFALIAIADGRNREATMTRPA